MKAERVRTIVTIIASLLGIFSVSVGVLISINRYFAKSSTVQLIEERLDVSILDDRIHQKQQDIDRLKALVEFEKKSTPISEVEGMVLQKQENELEELVKQRKEKVKYYEQRSAK